MMTIRYKNITIVEHFLVSSSRRGIILTSHTPPKYSLPGGMVVRKVVAEEFARSLSEKIAQGVGPRIICHRDGQAYLRPIQGARK